MLGLTCYNGLPVWSFGLWTDYQILEKWFSVMGTSAAGATKDLNLYLEQIGKIEQAEMVSDVKWRGLRALCCREAERV